MPAIDGVSYTRAELSSTPAKPTGSKRFRPDLNNSISELQGMDKEDNSQDSDVLKNIENIVSEVMANFKQQQRVSASATQTTQMQTWQLTTSYY